VLEQDGEIAAEGHLGSAGENAIANPAPFLIVRAVAEGVNPKLFAGSKPPAKAHVVL
jgi:hypothetical protein